MPEMLAWCADYETGNLMVDREHKALLDLVSLILMMDRKEGIEEREQALKVQLAALHRYMDQHFTDEENLLASVESPYFAKQRLLHNKLRTELTVLWAPGEASPSRETIHQLAVWSREHLLEHFLVFDQETFHAPPFAE